MRSAELYAGLLCPFADDNAVLAQIFIIDAGVVVPQVWTTMEALAFWLGSALIIST